MKEGYVVLGVVLGIIGLLTIWFCGWILMVIGLVFFIYGLIASDPQPIVIYQQQPPPVYYHNAPQQQPMGGQQYFCAYCGKPLAYVAQHQRWFCHSCNRYS